MSKRTVFQGFKSYDFELFKLLHRSLELKFDCESNTVTTRHYSPKFSTISLSWVLEIQTLLADTAVNTEYFKPQHIFLQVCYTLTMTAEVYQPLHISDAILKQT